MPYFSIDAAGIGLFRRAAALAFIAPALVALSGVIIYCHYLLKYILVVVQLLEIYFICGAVVENIF